jgi:hypothetical protein
LFFYNQIFEKNNLKEERFILAYSFRREIHPGGEEVETAGTGRGQGKM